MLWTLDDERDDDLLAVRYPYFEQNEPNVFDQGGTYVSTDVAFSHNLSHEWNHGLARRDHDRAIRRGHGDHGVHRA